MSTPATTTRTRPDLRRDASLSAVLAGFIAVAISYAGPLLVMLEAARAAGLSSQLTASWVWAISVGSGLVCLVMSWGTNQPVMVAWSIPGAALLITSLGGYRFSDAVGAYIVCGVVSVLLGATGLVGRLLQAVPRPITAAVLAGVLFPFALKVAAAVVGQPIVAGGLVLGYLLGRRWQPRYAVFLALAVGGVLAVLTGQAQTTIVSLFSAIPAGMLTALAGVALLSPLQAAIYDTMHEGDHHRSVTEAALITFAVTASGAQALGIMSAFWGLVAGLVAYAILRPRPR